MDAFLPTIILRHRRENLKKCSLRGLEQRSDIVFHTYPQDTLPPMDGYIALDLSGDPLSHQDSGKGLFLLDSTWRLEKRMQRSVPLLPKRSIPPLFRTAYPRRQPDCDSPDRGLASVEALYIAYLLMGKDPSGILDGYHWKDLFLTLNQEIFSEISIYPASLR